MSNEKINKEWQDLMSTYFEIPEGSAADKSMIELEEVFHLD
jgi:L-rhamnose mutarotase